MEVQIHVVQCVQEEERNGSVSSLKDPQPQPLIFVYLFYNLDFSFKFQVLSLQLPTHFAIYPVSLLKIWRSSVFTLFDFFGATTRLASQFLASLCLCDSLLTVESIIAWFESVFWGFCLM